MFKKIYKSFWFLIFIVSISSINVNAVEKENFLSVGDKKAKIIVKVFSSLTCPHCAHFHTNIFKNLKMDFIDKGHVRFEHHSFPLDLAALNAEKILNCSIDNEKKLIFLNELYEKQDQWAVGSDINSINSKLIKMAKNYGLNDDMINNCLSDEKLEEKILNSRIDGHKKYSITSTPTILINEKKYEGDHKYKNFKKVINKLL